MKKHELPPLPKTTPPPSLEQEPEEKEAAAPTEKNQTKEKNETQTTQPKKHWWTRRKNVEDPEKRAEEIVEKMRTQRSKKGPKKLQRKSLQEYLNKAGYDTDAGKLKKITFNTVIVSFLILTAAIVILAYQGGAHTSAQHFLRFIAFIITLWTIIFAGTCLISMGIIYFFLDYRIYNRTKQVEEVLPDFLQLASANISAGMPIDRALWYSIRPNFGVLAKEMEEVAKATMSGESLESSLIHFTQKYDSLLLKRSISILIEGLHSGGELADLLNKIALNIDELKIMKKEMAANVTTYAIFIIIAAIIISPGLFALATQLLVIIVGITSSLDLTSSSQMFSLGAVDPVVIKNFTMFSYMMLIVSSVFGASIVSVIQKGHVLDGIKSIPVYALVAIVVYKIASIMLGTMFGSIV